MQKASNKINAILYDRYYLKNCKAIIFEKIENHTKCRKPNAPTYVTLIFSDGTLIKEIIVSPPLSTVGGNRFSKECCLGEWVISFYLEHDDRSLGTIFEWRETWIKMAQINAFSRNVKFINLKFFPTDGGI